MAGIIIWVIIIVWIAYAASKKNQQKGGNGQARPTGSDRSAIPNRPAKPAGKGSAYNPWQGFDQAGNAMKQQATKERLQKKYNRPSQSGGDILQRARASVAEDFDKDNLKNFGDENSGTKSSGARAAGNVGKDAGSSMDAAAAMVQDAKKRQQEMERRIAEKLASAEAEQSDIMKTVEDLMVKGPDTSIAFERDFVSEGLDLLNRIQE